jgi:hypothetical protein
MIIDCEILLNSSLILHSFSSQKQDSYSQAMIIECGCCDDGGSKKLSNACALIPVLLTSTSWKQQPSQSPQWLLQTFQTHTFNLYVFLHWFVTVLYFQHYEFYILSCWVHILNSMYIKLKYQWSYYTGSKGSVSVLMLWTICGDVKCYLRHTNHVSEFLHIIFALRQVNKHMKGHLSSYE